MSTKELPTQNTKHVFHYDVETLLWKNSFNNAETDELEYAKQRQQNTYHHLKRFSNANPLEAGKLVEKHTLGLKAAIVAKSVPYANFTYASAAEARPQVENLLNVFLTFAPESIGGKLPDSGFYFK